MKTKPATLLTLAWPIADRNVWMAACKPHVRLKAGGRAGHMRASTRNGLASTYGQFLATCASNGQGTGTVTPCELVTPGNVAVFVDGLERRVSSVTVATIIYRLYRIACLLRPDVDWCWLCEIWLDRKDRMQRRSLSHRLVTGDRLYRLGVSLMQEADANERLNRRWRAGRYRNGLLVALLAIAPIRLANLHQLEIGRTLIRQENEWWIVLPASETKGRRPDEKPLGAELSAFIDHWIEVWRPAFNPTCDTLWPSPEGGTLAYTYVGGLVTDTTRKGLGVAVNPHLFRSCLVETLVTHAPEQAAMASPILQHTDHRTTQTFYNRGKARVAFAKYQKVILGRTENMKER